jgi:hypothetical protein
MLDAPTAADVARLQDHAARILIAAALGSAGDLEAVFAALGYAVGSLFRALEPEFRGKAARDWCATLLATIDASGEPEPGTRH